MSNHVSWWMIPLFPFMWVLMKLAPFIGLCCRMWYISVPLVVAGLFFAGVYFSDKF